jgi:HEPN domain-containing protein
VNRSDFQELAELHLRHAKALSDAQLYSGAYYMSGYTIECALKACIARRTNQFDFPDKRFASSAWTHDLAELAKVSGMKSDLDAAKQADDVLRANWQAVDGWSETSRYETHLQHEAESLLTAVSDPDHGVLACIKRYW